MGICCDTAEPVETTLKDLPAPSIAGVTDAYQRFELQTAFARTPFGPFVEAVEKAAGDKEYVTFESLAEQLQTPLWKTVSQKESPLYKLLSSPAFKTEEVEDGQIDKNRLIMFGLLHCVDSNKPLQKAKALYGILQDGGLEAHAQISAGDKDMKPTFAAICDLATVDLFDAANSVDGVTKFYDDEAVNNMKENYEVVLEEQWLEEIYGANARVENAEWLEAVTTTAKWIFNAVELRERILKAAEIDPAHFE